MSENASSPLHDAAAKGDIDTLNRLLSEGAPVDDRDAECRTPLMFAARAGQETVCRHLLKWGARVDAESSTGMTPLMRASRGGHATIVRLLLAHGADPNQVIHPTEPAVNASQKELLHKSSESLGGGAAADMAAKMREQRFKPRKSSADNLMRAVMGGDLDTLSALLEAGTDIGETKSVSDMSPLRMASSLGKLEMVRLLMRYGADIHAADSHGTTPLQHAVMNQRLEVARLLLESGADPDAGHMQPLVFAIIRSNLELIKLLLEFGAKTGPTGDGRALVSVLLRSRPEIQALVIAHQGIGWHEAVRQGNLDAVRESLDAGVSIDARDDKGNTALLVAATAGHAPVVQLLLDRGAEIEAVNEFRHTPLLCAIFKDETEVARLLVARGANVNAVSQWGHTAIFLAATDKRREIREVLIAADARVGIVDAAKMGDEAQVTAFLAAGVPVDERNESGMTALMAAAGQGHVSLATMLHERGASLEARDSNLERPPFQFAVQHAIKTGSTELLELMIRWGADIDGPGKYGSTGLQDAVEHRSEKIIRFLLDNGADPNKRMSPSERPVLHTAIQLGRGDLTPILVLLDHGADIEGTDKHGATPLMQAVQLTPQMVMAKTGDGKEYIHAVVRLLIARGANVNAQGERGTVLGLAAEAGNIEVVRMLLDAGADPTGSHLISPLASASLKGHREIAALLRERGASDRPVGTMYDGIPEGVTSALMAIAGQPSGAAKFLEALNKARQKQPKQ